MAVQTKNVVLALLESDNSDNFKSWLNGLLHRGPVIVEFTKVDGTTRNMRCTLKEDLIEAVTVDEPSGDTLSPKRFRATSPHVRTVWDIDNRGWRSFRWDKIVTVSWDDGEVE